MTFWAVLLGRFAPLSLTSKTLLLQELKTRGIPTARFPYELIRQLSDEVVSNARLNAKFGSFTLHEGVVHGTENIAERIAEIFGIQPPARWDDDLRRSQRAQLSDRLKHYGLI